MTVLVLDPRAPSHRDGTLLHALVVDPYVAGCRAPGTGSSAVLAENELHWPRLS